MMIEAVISGVVALITGYVIARFTLKGDVKKAEEDAHAKAGLILKEAKIKQESIKKEKILQAKEKYIELKQEFDQTVGRKKEQITQNENKIRQKEKNLSKQIEQNNRKEAELDSAKENLQAQLEIVKKRKTEIDRIKTEEASKLEKIANLSADEATDRLVELMTNEAQTRATQLIKSIEDEAKLTATKKAKKIVIETIQRTASETSIENCVSIFNIESDDIKGKIIGREGRNIRALEAATGVEIIVDDTPEAIIISGHDPVRREIARLALHRLVTDGRIHPARIEEIVKKTTKEINEEITEIGERTVIDLSIHGLHPQLIKMVVIMRFRSSYGQNLLQHSREVSNMCALMAAELGINVKLAKRAGLLHDIGKVAEDQELPHAIAGMELAKKYKEHPEVCNAIGLTMMK